MNHKPGKMYNYFVRTSDDLFSENHPNMKSQQNFTF